MADLFPSRKPASPPAPAPAGRRRPRRPPAGYVLGLMLVGGATVLLPVSFAALVAGLGRGLLWHLQAHLGWVRGPDAGATGLLAYILLALCLALPFAFLLRPLLSRPYRHSAGIALDPESEPRLFAFVGQICEALGSP